MSEKDRIGAGITEEMFRLSVGTEDVEDLIHDFDQALASPDPPKENVNSKRSRTVTPVPDDETGRQKRRKKTENISEEREKDTWTVEQTIAAS
jgi:hypothetical protein